MVPDILGIVSFVISLFEFSKMGWKLIKGKTLKEVLSSSEFIIFIVTLAITFAIFFPWSKLHISYGDKSTTIESFRIDSPKVVPSYKFDPAKTLKTASKKAESNSESKYDLRDAKINQSAVGDNAKVENYNGVKPRQLDSAMFFKLMDDVKRFLDAHPEASTTSIEVAASPDEDSRQLAEQVEYVLKQNNIKVSRNHIPLSPMQSRNKENFDIIPDMNGKGAMIVVLAQPNIQ